MGSTYTRQSSTEIVDGEVIQASDFNNEFEQLVSAFAASTGHSHDGTTAEGGNVTKLLGTAITIGDGTSGTDITVTFDGETSDGVLTWMEDEDHFKFSDDVVIDSTKRLYLNDEGGEYIYGDGTDLYLVSGADINIPANIGMTFGNDGEKIEGDGTDLTITGNNINLTATADVVIPADVGITFGSGEKIEGDSTDLTVTSGAKINLTATSDVVIPSGVGLILDGSGNEKIESDGTDISISVGSGGDVNIPADIGVTFGDDGEKIEGDGTNLTISTSNNVTVDAAADIILDAGGADVTLKDDGTTFGSLTNSGGELVIKSGSTPTTAMTFSGANVTFGGTVTIGSAGISEAELEILDGATVTTTELNLIDGDTARGTTSVASGDGILINDGGTMRMTNVDTVTTYFASHNVGGSNIVTTGALDSGSITSGFGAIDNGTSGIRTNTFTAETAFVPDASDGATLGTASLEFSDLYLADGGQILFGNDQDVTVTHDADDGLILKSIATGDDNPFLLTIQTGETDIAVNDVLGAINFQAPDESQGTDAILVAAGIEAVSEGDFSSSNNATKLSFKTAASEAAAEKASLSSTGVFTATSFTGSGAGLTAGTTPVTTLDIDGATDIGEAIVDADLFIIDNGAGGTNRKTTASRLKTYIGSDFSDPASADGDSLGTASLEWSDLYLADGGVIYFGNDQEITLTHVADTGLNLKHAATADDKFPTLTLQTGDTDIASADKLGVINFQAPDEGTGTDAILVAAGIEAVSEGNFSSSNNATKLSFKTAASEAASEKMIIDSEGNIGINESSPSSYYGNAPRFVISNTNSGEETAITIRSATDGIGLLSFADTNSGNARFAGFVQYVHSSDLLSLGIANSAEVRLNATGFYPASADGNSLGIATNEWADLYLADSGVIYFGNDQDVTITHDPDDGLFLKSTATADDNPFLLTLQTGETDIAADDVLGKIAFQAPDEGTGTDAILVSAAIQARAEGNFSSSSNATSIDFMTGASEAAATKMTLGSDGTLNLNDNTLQRANLKDYGEITSALGSAGGSRTIDLEDGNSFSATVTTSTVTWTFSNPTASDELCGFTLTLVNGGSQTVNWPGSVDWAGGSAPSLTSSGTDVLVFFTIDGGTIWHGMVASADTK